MLIVNLTFMLGLSAPLQHSPPPVVALPAAVPVVVVAPVPAPVLSPPVRLAPPTEPTTTTTTTPALHGPVTITATDCIVTLDGPQVDPQTGATVPVTMGYEGSCNVAEAYAAVHPGAVVSTHTFTYVTVYP